MVAYSSVEFRDLDDYPSENTLTLNVTHKQLTRLSSTFDKCVAIGPTRFEEGTSTDPSKPLGDGYDVTFDTAKEIVFQHKSPSNTVVREDEHGEKRKWMNFKIDTSQLLALALQYNPREAYYALPVVPERHQLKQCLDRTVFVDAYALFLHSLSGLKETSRIYVEYLPRLFTRSKFTRKQIREFPKAKGKYNDQRRIMSPDIYYDLVISSSPHGDALFWEPIEKRLKKCSMGLPIIGIDLENFRWHSEIESLPPGFDTSFSEYLSPMYREHLRRRWAINEYARNDDSREILFNWFIESLEIRYERAKSNEISVWEDNLFENGEVISIIRSALDDLSTANYPASYGLGGIRRHILEKDIGSNQENQPRGPIVTI